MKKGIVSMSIIYTFLIVFLIMLTGMMADYLVKSNMVDAIINEAKEEIYETS